MENSAYSTLGNQTEVQKTDTHEMKISIATVKNEGDQSEEPSNSSTRPKVKNYTQRSRFSVGTEVYYKLEGRKGWYGPAVIADVLGGETYKIEEADGTQIPGTQKISGSRLRKYSD